MRHSTMQNTVQNTIQNAGQTGGEGKQVIWAWFPVTLITAVFCCVLWGSASPAIKIAYELFRIGPDDTASRIMLAGARFMIAGVMTIVFGSILAKKFLVPKRESWKNVATWRWSRLWDSITSSSWRWPIHPGCEARSSTHRATSLPFCLRSIFSGLRK